VGLGGGSHERGWDSGEVLRGGVDKSGGEIGEEDTAGEGWHEGERWVGLLGFLQKRKSEK
jgi:hypothetical protein